MKKNGLTKSDCVIIEQAKSYKDRGRLERTLARYEQATADFSKALELCCAVNDRSPSNIEALLLKSGILTERSFLDDSLGQKTNQLADLQSASLADEAAAKLAPNSLSVSLSHAFSLGGLSQAYAFGADTDTEKAIKFSQQAGEICAEAEANHGKSLELLRRHGDSLIGKAQAEIQARQSKAAVEDATEALQKGFDEILRDAPGSLPDLRRKAGANLALASAQWDAYLAVRTELLQTAVRQYDEILQRTPNDIDTLVSKGNALVKLAKLPGAGDGAILTYSQAVDSFDKSLKLAPDSTATLTAKGFALDAKGSVQQTYGHTSEGTRSFEEAVSTLNHVLTITPSNTNLKKMRNIINSRMFLTKHTGMEK